MISIRFCYRNLPNSTGLLYASYGRNNRRLFERGVWPPRSPDLTTPRFEEKARSSERKRSKIPHSIWGLSFSQRGCWRLRWPPRSPDLTTLRFEEKARSSERKRSKIPHSIWSLRFSQRGCWRLRWPTRSPDLTTPRVEERTRSSERKRSKIPHSIWGLVFSQRGCWRLRSAGILYHIKWQIFVL